MKLNDLVRKNIKELVPYSSARHEHQNNQGIFLDANENPFGFYNRYPDPFQNKLKKKISEIKKIPKNNIFLGNGSDEIVDLIFRIFCNPLKDKAIIFFPTYGMYEVSAKINDIELIKIPLNNHFHIDLNLIKSYYKKSHNLKVIFICSPNNPTGNLFKKESIEDILHNFKGIVIIDEAYIDFANTESFIYRLQEFSNLIVMQTFSKAFGLANIRIGMAFANTNILHYFNKIKYPYNISGINQKIVLNKLNDYKIIQNRIKNIIVEKEKLIQEFKKNKIIKKIYPSDTNFILLKVENSDKIYNFLIKKKIIIRNQSKIIKNCIRITIGKEEENKKLIYALNTFNI